MDERQEEDRRGHRSRYEELWNGSAENRLIAGAAMSLLSICIAALFASFSATNRTVSFFIVFFVVLLLVVLDQMRYRLKKGFIPGPHWIPPFIGNLLSSFHPSWEGYMKLFSLGDVCCTSVLHKFIVFAISNDLSRKTFNTPDTFVPAGPASMKTILCEDNWVFLEGKAHLEFRKRLLPLFTRSALATYLPLQQAAYKESIDEWLREAEEKKDTKPIEMQWRLRDMNMATALNVFCGERYLPPGAAAEMSQEFKNITLALELVNIPLAVPGTAVYSAIQSRKKIMALLSHCIDKAKERLSKPGEVPVSMLDRWLDVMKKEREEWEKKNKKQGEGEGEAPKEFNNNEIGLTILSMIFASQDASTSSLTWAVQALADHPEVLQQVREEQARVRPNKEEITYENLQRMTYTWRVTKELLRWKPPVMMMLYEAKKDTTLGGHHVEKGTLIGAALFPSLHNPVAYQNPERFDPDRFSPERGEDTKSASYYMVWGHGPHACIGKEYAMRFELSF
eukprot:TRINITY_DN5115_c0_g1_i4.p1 TRINITY_DN5115_c0_g1~~TRINITY_DN5115_c0_g1_i4.p1  ORF type:complete len:508 (-),score=128.85 TRINITY_DN5115_c0_g1_i4:47-1570(-)